MSAKHWLTVENKADSAEILIQGRIGKDWYDDSGVSEKEFVSALDAIPQGKKITIGINSEGGSVKDGLGIYNAIKRRASDITCRVDGYAVSIASVIALGGGRVISPKSSIWMIHEPSMVTYGNAADMLRAAVCLEEHAKTIRDVYQEETGMAQDEAKKLMADETWFRGEQAIAMGFADELSDEQVAMNSIDFAKFKNVPKDILSAGIKSAAPSNSEPSAPAELSADTGETPASNAGSSNQTNTNKVTPMPEQAKAEVPANQAPVVDLSPVIDAINALGEKMNKNTETASTGGAAPLPPVTIANVGNAWDKFNEMKPGASRREYLAAAWSDVQKEGMRTQKVENVNTISATLAVTMLNDTVTTILQSKLAPFRAFAGEISPQPLAPANPIVFPKVTASSAALTDPTDWESGDATVDVVTVTPHEYAVSMHITNSQLQTGSRIEWLTRVKAATFANKLLDILMAPITTTNFAEIKVGAAAGFQPSDLQTILAGAKEYVVKNLILDGAYTARLVPSNTEGLPWTNGGPRQGFDGIWECNRWTGAGANAVGFSCDPQALVYLAGAPLSPPGAGTQFSQLGVSTVPTINIPVQTAAWFKPGTRVMWMAFDTVLGVSANDTTAGTILTSA